MNDIDITTNAPELDPQTIVNNQTLHQWRMIWDGDYRLEYNEFLEECGLTIDSLNEYRAMLIPLEDMSNG